MSAELEDCAVPIKDYYKILGVEKNADQNAIKSRFRKLAKELHPDVNPGDKDAEKKFTEISEAYDVLGSADNRKKYDALVEQQRSGRFHAPGGVQYSYAGGMGDDGVDWDAILSTMFGWEGGSYAAGRRGASDGDSGYEFEGFRGFQDSGGIFGGDSRFNSALDIENMIQVPLKEAFTGAEKTIRIAGKDQVRFKIPAGIQPGERVRLDSLGKEDGSGRRGDRLLKIELTAETGVALDGINLTVEREIAPWDAALGTTLPLSPLDKEIKVKVKPGTRGGTVLRVRGQGYIDRAGRRGDLLVKLTIQNPAALPEAARKAYEEIHKG
ncbi:MAG: DnaJ domain-containing protein [Oscillospiraceae bacterium]|nr:DnaJ domain-containing protein [Oscillospiraceae bacterium]